jgi:PmbA protein
MSGYEVYSYRSSSASLVYGGGELKTKEGDELLGFGVRALEDGRIGFGFCQNEGDLKAAIEEAKSLSRFSVRSGFSFAPKASFYLPDILEPAYESPDMETLKSYVDDTRAAIESRGGKARVMTSIESSSVHLENTSGFDASYKKTVFSLYAESMNGDGFGYSYITSHHPPLDLNDAGAKAADMAVAMQSASKPEGGLYTVVMELESLDSLVETLLPSFSGDWKRRKITRLSPGPRLHGSLTICEDGLAAGIGARPFDDEGTPSVRRALVENGEVKAFLYDRETSALEGAEGSGACSRASYDSQPAISPSNIVISPGTYKDLGELDRYIEVHYAHGSHTANLTSGDIGLEASAAFLVERGKRKPIKGFLISGNVFDMFSNIEAIESAQRTYGTLIAPRIAFKDVRIVA